MDEGCRLIDKWYEAGGDDVFARLMAEVAFQEMHNYGSKVPRLVAVQVIPGSAPEKDSESNSDVPVYRHPTDISPPTMSVTPTVAKILSHASTNLGRHFNHALIQLYRSGHDNISEHSDKTLDLVPASFILNASFGAQRTMTLRYKANKDVSIASIHDRHVDAAARRGNKNIILPHNSLLIMPLSVNAAWTHAIRANKRAQTELSPAETAYGGSRISITMREIGTFVTPDGKIYGCGALGKSRVEANDIDRSAEAWNELVKSFGRENRGRCIDIERYYGPGSDALNTALS